MPSYYFIRYDFLNYIDSQRFTASCQRHEISKTPHETNGVSAVWGLRKNIFDFFIRLFKMFIGEQQKTMVRNTL